MPALDVKEAAGGNAGDYVSIRIDAPELCPRFATRVLKDIKITESPEWMQRRLRACGVRPIAASCAITCKLCSSPIFDIDCNSLAKLRRLYTLSSRCQRPSSPVL